MDDWKKKVSDLQRELESANSEGRGHAAEVFSLRAQIDESHEHLDAMRRENKNLSGTQECNSFDFFSIMK